MMVIGIGGSTFISSKISEERISVLKQLVEAKLDKSLFDAEKESNNRGLNEIKVNVQRIFDKIDEIKNMMIKKE
jgi:hypothetical protein